jgi:hypothetical protein
MGRHSKMELIKQGNLRMRDVYEDIGKIPGKPTVGRTEPPE